MRCQRNTERAQQLGAVDAGGSDALLDLHLHRRPIHRGGEGEEVHRVLGRQRNVLVGLVDPDLRHRKGDQHGDRLVGGVEEAIADAHLLGRDRQVLGAHFDVLVAHEDEPAGREFGRGVIGERRYRRDTCNKQSER